MDIKYLFSSPLSLKTYFDDAQDDKRSKNVNILIVVVILGDFVFAANGPAIKVGCVSRRQHRSGTVYPPAGGPEKCPGARRVWRIFCTRLLAKNVTNNLPLLSVLN